MVPPMRYGPQRTPRSPSRYRESCLPLSISKQGHKGGVHPAHELLQRHILAPGTGTSLADAGHCLASCVSGAQAGEQRFSPSRAPFPVGLGRLRTSLIFRCMPRTRGDAAPCPLGAGRARFRTRVQDFTPSRASSSSTRPAWSSWRDSCTSAIRTQSADRMEEGPYLAGTARRALQLPRGHLPVSTPEPRRAPVGRRSPRGRRVRSPGRTRGSDRDNGGSGGIGGTGSWHSPAEGRKLEGD